MIITVYRILFVINTLGQAGAETALLSLLQTLAREKGEARYEISLYVLTGQGEMVSRLPADVRLLNKKYREESVLTAKGRKYLKKTVLKAMFTRATVVKLFPYLVKNTCAMLGKKRLLPDKLLWRVLSDGGMVLPEEYDLAVSYLEGGAAYFVADHVKAAKKAAFIHVDYEKAGYTRALDKDCYLAFDKIFTVSDEVREAFLKAYPELPDKTEVFHNILNKEEIVRRAEEGEGFTDGFTGMRLLSVGRLTAQKAFEVSVDAMKRLKDAGKNVRWYVLGEGDQRKKLQEQIDALGLTEDFILYGAVNNPYPFMKQADIYVHASRFEGKSIAIQEAQILGKPMVVSDCSGNREQVCHGKDGLMCGLTPDSLAENIMLLLEDEALRGKLGAAAAKKNADAAEEIQKLLSMLKG
ncbi:MAG: glycosyltransferase [Lachnospiraceae bacterium]|nr:glycosyltransferase [Clostridium sp.]MDY4821708.1 glycosyltransferase [Lachnospiraceae bacterium]